MLQKEKIIYLKSYNTHYASGSDKSSKGYFLGKKKKSMLIKVKLSPVSCSTLTSNWLKMFSDNDI